MIEMDIPGFGVVKIEHLICDYNGTLAYDGRILAGVAERMVELSESVDVHVVTADTLGMAEHQLSGLPCMLKVLPGENQDEAKLAYLEHLGAESTICIGNGRNDRLMLAKAIIGIAVIQEEGAAIDSVSAADVVCLKMTDALNLVLRPEQLITTLRN